MVGTPGSGKTTYAKTCFPNALYISRDEIRFKIVPEQADYFSKEKEVFKTFVEQINNGLRDSIDVIADATHLNEKSRMKLLSHLNIDKNKTEVIAVVMRTPLEVCIKRNESRKGTRSYVPISSIRRMFFSFKIPTYEECNGMIETIRIVTMKGDN
jgi:predicted kinase